MLVGHSPTSTPVRDMQRGSSTPEMSTINPDQTNITSRNKRFRPEFSPEKEGLSFETRILSLLTDWKRDQDIVLSKLSSDFAEVKSQNTKIEKSIESINARYECMKQTVDKLQEERSDYRSFTIQLEKRVDDLQRSSRSSGIEIRNVPFNVNETADDLSVIVLKICNAIQSPMVKLDLRDVYRLPGKKGSSRPIVAELQTVQQRIKVLDAARIFNKDRPVTDKLNTGHIAIDGPLMPIYVSESLPGYLKQLFYEARAFAKSNNYKYCWSRYGKLFLRENDESNPITITSLACLKQLAK
ncbi:Zinc finger DNA binding protein [Operophtera brumata]|uniref:Zinc finger DNA binding protein n=1 Tax=Operophtera brumata TaxID=104452 RepID=A0A0L7K4K8_OPEBR|nr:Zinc finger DNA binding protein [Operophtera brumata]